MQLRCSVLRTWSRHSSMPSSTASRLFVNKTMAASSAQRFMMSCTEDKGAARSLYAEPVGRYRPELTLRCRPISFFMATTSSGYGNPDWSFKLFCQQQFPCRYKTSNRTLHEQHSPPFHPLVKLQTYCDAPFRDYFMCSGPAGMLHHIVHHSWLVIHVSSAVSERIKGND